MRRPIARTVVFSVLSFLLLFMQQQGAVHALSHLGPQLARSHETELVAPHADNACVECALLATGTGAVVGADQSLVSALPVPELAWFEFRSRAAETPSFFQSRAPPILL